MPEKFLLTPSIDRSDNIIKNHLFRRQFSLKNLDTRKFVDNDVEVEEPLKVSKNFSIACVLVKQQLNSSRPTLSSFSRRNVSKTLAKMSKKLSKSLE